MGPKTAHWQTYAEQSGGNLIVTNAQFLGVQDPDTYCRTQAFAGRDIAPESIGELTPQISSASQALKAQLKKIGARWIGKLRFDGREVMAVFADADLLQLGYVMRRLADSKQSRAFAADLSTAATHDFIYWQTSDGEDSGTAAFFMQRALLFMWRALSHPAIAQMHLIEQPVDEAGDVFYRVVAAHDPRCPHDIDEEEGVLPGHWFWGTLHIGKEQIGAAAANGMVRVGSYKEAVVVPLRTMEGLFQPGHPGHLAGMPNACTDGYSCEGLIRLSRQDKQPVVSGIYP